MDKKHRISDSAVQKATGRTWQEWFVLLDEAGMQHKTHKDIARWLVDIHEVSSWWAQSITVEFEHHHGKRVVGETKDAGFQIGVQKTFDTTSEYVWRVLTSQEGIAIWLGETDLKLQKGKTYTTVTGVTGQIRSIEEGTKLRLTLQPPNGQTSTLQIHVLPSGNKTSLRSHHEKLRSSDEREAMKVHWRAIIGRLTPLIGKK